MSRRYWYWAVLSILWVSIVTSKGWCEDAAEAAAKVEPLMEIVVPTDYPTLAEAYENLAEDGILWILEGEYEVPEAVVITKNVRMVGNEENPEKVVLRGDENYVLEIQAGTVEIAGITFKNEGSRFVTNDAVLFSAADGELRNCSFYSTCNSGFAVEGKDSNPTVISCTARECGQAGFSARSGAKGTFRECGAFENSYEGMLVSGEGTCPTVEKCQFHNGKKVENENWNADGIHVCAGASGIFRECTASGNPGAGIAVCGKGTNPTVESCQFTKGKGNGIYVLEGAAGVFKNCTVSENQYPGMYVHGKETNPTVETCEFTKGKSNGVIVLEGAAGTYKNCTVSENELAGMYVSGAGTNPTVDTCQFIKGKDSGIYVLEGAAGTFKNCTVSENELDGMYVRGAGTNPTVEVCKFLAGKGVGVYVNNGAAGTFQYCDFLSNEVAGITVSGKGSRPFVQRCFFKGNTEYGVYIFDSGSGKFINNQLLQTEPWLLTPGCEAYREENCTN